MVKMKTAQAFFMRVKVDAWNRSVLHDGIGIGDAALGNLHPDLCLGKLDGATVAIQNRDVVAQFCEPLLGLRAQQQRGGASANDDIGAVLFDGINAFAHKLLHQFRSLR